MTHISLGQQQKDKFNQAYSMCGKCEYAYKVLVRKHKTIRCLRRPTQRFEENIKLNLKNGWTVWTHTSASYVHFVFGSDTHCLAPTYKTTWHHTPEDNTLNVHCHENLTFDVIHLAWERNQW